MKRILILTAAFVLSGCCMFGQTPPTVNVDLKAKFFKAQSELSQAQLAMERTKEFQQHQQKAAEFQTVVNELIGVCGKDFQPGLSKDGDPICLPKPEPVKPPAKAEAPKPAVKK